MNTIEEFLTEGQLAGCSREQLNNFARAMILLQPRQLAASAAARRCDQPDGPTAVGFGGARGGGKSHWLLAQLGADDCQRVPGLKCLLLRKVGKSNLENFEDLRRRVFPKLPHLFTSSKNTVSFDNGSRIVLGHYQHETDIDTYLGLEYDVIAIEEATTLTHRKYLDISTCCRTSKPDWRPRIYCTANPGGVGHVWFKKIFVDPSRTRKAEGGRDAAPSASASASLRTGSPATIFISATVADNSHINPEYTSVLNRLTGWQKRAWLHGDWDIAAGQFFPTFRRDIHVISEFDINLATEWFAAMDYGYRHYTVVLLGAKDADGNMYVVDEHAARLWLPDRHNRAIRAMLHHYYLDPDKLRFFAAGHDCFAVQGNGFTIAKQYGDLGINLRKANTERVPGWAEILRRLGDPENGTSPTLFIHERCVRLIECLPNLQHDPLNPEDLMKIDTDDAGEGGDDPADALRYLVAQRVFETRVVKLFRPRTQLDRTRSVIAGKPWPADFLYHTD
jgi:hypothetical protein